MPGVVLGHYNPLSLTSVKESELHPFDFTKRAVSHHILSPRLNLDNQPVSSDIQSRRELFRLLKQIKNPTLPFSCVWSRPGDNARMIARLCKRSVFPDFTGH